MIYGDEAINLLAASPIIGLIVRTLVSVPGVTRQRVWMSRRSNFAGIEPCRCHQSFYERSRGRSGTDQLGE